MRRGLLPVLLVFLGAASSDPAIARDEPAPRRPNVVLILASLAARRAQLRRCERYHLADDPGEKVNLYGQPDRAPTVGELRGRLEAFFREHADPKYDL